MSVNFNGDVTVNGNMEVSGDGNVKITGNEVNVDVSALKDFIEKELPYSENKEEYKKAAEILSNPPQDKNLIKGAFYKMLDFFKESGKVFWITGLRATALEVAKEIAKHI